MPSFFGKSNPSPRTAADRERERLERERRRGVTPGDGGPPEPDPEDDAVPEPDAPGGEAFAGSASLVREGGAGSDGRADAVSALVRGRATGSDGRADAVSAPLVRGGATGPDGRPGAAARDGRADAARPDGDGDTARPEAPPADGPDAPTQTARQVGRARTGEGLAPMRGGSATVRRRRVTASRAIALIVVVLAAGAVWFGVELFEPFTGSGHGRVVVDVPRGAGASQIGDLLAQRGVVASGFFFNLYASLEGDRGDLHSGQYVLREGMSYSAALAVLTQPPPAPPVINVVIPEGDSRVQIAALARGDGLTGSYLAASVRSPVLNPARYGAPRGTPNLEGFLFPATYDLVVGANVGTLVGDQLIAFQQNIGPSYRRAAHRLHLTLYQLLTVASMIEREAYLPADRPKVAAVIYNRLRLSMPLGIDATLRYALNDWNAPLTDSQLVLDSPYNTRLRIGLPPTPIGNPGLASLNAAAHPAAVPYLYYVDGADGCGDLVFASTSAAFDQAAAAYHAALAANGGRVPTCHHG